MPDVAHITCLYPRGTKFTLFSLYGQQFPRYGLIFKIAIFGHETSQVAKVPEVAHVYAHSLPQGVQIELIFALWAAVSDTQADFQNCHIWACHLAIGQSARCCTYTVKLVLRYPFSTPGGRNGLIWADFQNSHIRE